MGELSPFEARLAEALRARSEVAVSREDARAQARSAITAAGRVRALPFAPAVGGQRRLLAVMAAAAVLLAVLVAGMAFVGAQPPLRADDGPADVAGRYTNGLLAWDRGDQVLFVSPDGSEARGGVAGSAGLHPLGWAPGGSTLLLEGGQGLFLSEPRTGSNPMLLWNGEPWSAAWAPDGDRLAVIRGGMTSDDEIGVEIIDRTGSLLDTWRLPSADGYQDEFGRSLAVPISVAWAPDGSAIAAVVCVGRECFESPGAGRLDLVLVGPDPTAARVLLSDWVSAAEWSPDGRWISYESSPAGGVSVVDVETGVTRLVKAGAWSPKWSPDGRRLAYVDVSDDVGQVGITRSDGSLEPATEPLTLGAHGLGVVDMTWSGDGASIAFTSYDRRQTHKVVDIWVVGADGQNERRIVEGGPIGPGAPVAYWERIPASVQDDGQRE